MVMARVVDAAKVDKREIGLLRPDVPSGRSGDQQVCLRVVEDVFKAVVLHRVGWIQPSQWRPSLEHGRSLVLRGQDVEQAGHVGETVARVAAHSVYRWITPKSIEMWLGSVIDGNTHLADIVAEPVRTNSA